MCLEFTTLSSPPFSTLVSLIHFTLAAGPTCELAHRKDCRDSIAGVLLECGILSGGSVLLGPSAGRMLAWPADIFTNYAKIPRVRQKKGEFKQTQFITGREPSDALKPYPLDLGIVNKSIFINRVLLSS